MFRMGGSARLALLQNSPKLYQLIKEQDQKEINLYFGYIKVKESRTAVSADKEKELEPLDFDEPQFLRNWSGQVVKASKQEEFAVYREETQPVNSQP
jgi:hypothetical protein